MAPHVTTDICAQHRGEARLLQCIQDNVQHSILVCFCFVIIRRLCSVSDAAFGHVLVARRFRCRRQRDGLVPPRRCAPGTWISPRHASQAKYIGLGVRRLGDLCARRRPRSHAAAAVGTTYSNRLAFASTAQPLFASSPLLRVRRYVLLLSKILEHKSGVVLLRLADTSDMACALAHERGRCHEWLDRHAFARHLASPRPPARRSKSGLRGVHPCPMVLFQHHETSSVV